MLSTPVSNIDLFATLLDALGGLQGPSVDSESLLPDLGKGAEPKGRVGVAESGTQRAILAGGFYLRRDRRAPSDLDFWQSRHRYTGALRRPLKSLRFTSLKENTVVERAAASANDLPKRNRHLYELLDEFKNRVAILEPELEAAREGAGASALSDAEKRQLRNLGYLE